MNFIKSTKEKLEEFIQNKPVSVQIPYGEQPNEQELCILKQIFEEKNLKDYYDWQKINKMLQQILIKQSDLKLWVNKDDNNQSDDQKTKQYIQKPFESFKGNADHSIIHTDNYPLNITFIPLKYQIHPNPNEMKNSVIGISLTKSQLQTIQQNGTFITITEGGQVKTWQISENFYMSNQAIQKLANKLGQPNFSEIYCNQHTRERIRNQNFDLSRFNMKYWNLRDALQTIFFDTPLQLLNCLIGIPIAWHYFQGLNYYIQAIWSQENFTKQYQNLAFNYYFQQMILEFDMVKAMAEIIQQLQWSQELYDQLKNLKMHLLVSCMMQFFNQDCLKLLQNQTELFKDEFLSIFIIDYFKKQILNQQDSLDQVKILMAECQSFLKQYQFRSYEKQINSLNNQIANLSTESLFKLSSKVIYDKYDYYFYKIINLWKESSQLESLKNSKQHIKFLWRFIFTVRDCDQLTVHTLFNQVKQKIEINLKKLEEQANEDLSNNNDEDGIFGDCCIRCSCGSYLFNYICLYFLTGIVLINIMCRIFGFFYLFLNMVFLAFLYAYVLLIFLIKYSYSVLIYNKYVDPENLNHPCYFPVFQILFLNPALGILKIFYSLFFIIVYLFKYVSIKLRILPIYLKNCFTFMIIRILGQIPDRDSSYCYLVSKKDEEKYFLGLGDLKSKQMKQPSENNLKSRFALKHFSIEQIIFYINQKINNSYYRNIQKKLIYQYNSHLEQYKENLQKQFSQLPFPKTNILDVINFNMQSFKQSISQILERSYITKCQIQFSEGWRLFYEKEHLQQIYQQIQDHLQQLQSESPEKISHLWTELLVQKGNYQMLAEHYLKKMFFQYLREKNQFNQNLFAQLTRSRDFNIKSDSLYSEINSHLNICFLQEIRFFEKQELDLKSLMQQQIPSLKMNNPTH
ncbi:hypothetical protein ABPG72_010831 [Tetrahymena utriculariae]